jgi:hypothetical protein
MDCYKRKLIAGWSSQVARRAHNPKVGGSNPSPATKDFRGISQLELIPFVFVGVEAVGKRPSAIRQAVRPAHGPEQSRRTHGPAQSRHPAGGSPVSEAPVPGTGSTTGRDFAKLNLHMDIFHQPLRNRFFGSLVIGFVFAEIGCLDNRGRRREGN